VGHVSRYGGLLHLEASCAMVLQSGLKLCYVTLSRRLRRDQVKDGWVDAIGCVRPCYPYFIVSYVLVPMSIVVF
jgi:hypothetical protein